MRHVLAIFPIGFYLRGSRALYCVAFGVGAVWGHWRDARLTGVEEGGRFDPTTSVVGIVGVIGGAARNP